MRRRGSAIYNQTASGACQGNLRWAGADHSDVRIAQRPLPVLVVKQEDAGEGEIALTPGIFLEGPAPAARPFRQVQLGDDLVRLAERRQRPGQKIGGAYRARSGRAEEGDFS